MIGCVSVANSYNHITLREGTRISRPGCMVLQGYIVAAYACYLSYNSLNHLIVIRLNGLDNNYVIGHKGSNRIALRVFYCYCLVRGGAAYCTYLTSTRGKNIRPI